MLFRCIIFTIFFSGAVSASTLNITIENVQSGQGEIRLGLFSPEQAEDFPDGERYKEHKQVADSETMQVTFDNIPNGTYALAIFQDKNTNEKLDKNFLGIPKEPYAFSGKQVTGRASKFKEAQFTISTEQHSETLKLSY